MIHRPIAVPDQAAALRELMRPPSSKTRATRVLTVASGKGGVGKTSISVNLALSLARDGLKVVVLDADLGLANVDVMLGIVPKATLADVVAGRMELGDVIQAAPGGIWVIPGGSGLEQLANLTDEGRRSLADSLGQLDGRADVLIIDTAAGIGTEVSSFIEAAPELLVVTTPEPTAITDAYALIKVANRLGSERTIRLVINQVNDVGESRDVARKIIHVAREFLNASVELLGHVPADPYLQRSVRAQMPVALAYPSSPASLAIRALGRSLISPSQQVAGSRSTIISLLRRLARQGVA